MHLAGDIQNQSEIEAATPVITFMSNKSQYDTARRTDNDHIHEYGNNYYPLSPKRDSKSADKPSRTARGAIDRLDIRSESGNTTRSKWFLLCRYWSPSPLPFIIAVADTTPAWPTQPRLPSLYEWVGYSAQRARTGNARSDIKTLDKTHDHCGIPAMS